MIHINPVCRINPTRVAAIIKSQFFEFRRDFGSIFLSFVFPLFFVVLLVAGSLTATSFTLEFGAVNAGADAQTREFATALAAKGVSLKNLDKTEAMNELSKGAIKAVVIFPADGLGTDAARPDGQAITLLADPQFADFAGSLLQATRARLLLQTGPAANAFRFRVQTPPAGKASQFDFIYPGMLALALVQIGVFLTATPLLKAREKGTLRYLLLTPLTVPELVAGQVIFRGLIALAQILLLMIVGSFVVHLDAGQWLRVFAVASLGGLMLVAVGYALAGIPSTLESGMSCVMIANFAMMFGGNIFWDPSHSLALRSFAFLMPPSYLADLFRQIINGTPGLLPAWADILAILIFSAAALLVSIKTFSFDTRREYRRPKMVRRAA